MRLPARRIATSALCAGLLIGLSGPAVMAADGGSARERTHAASHAPLPDAAELQNQVGSLAGLGGVLTPVTDLLSAVLEADNGRLSTEEADKLAAAAKDALAKADAADAADAEEAVTAPGTTSPDATTPGTTTPSTTTPGTSTPVKPPVVTAPEAETPVTLPAPVVAQSADGTTAATAAAADLAAAAQAALQVRIDALVKATTSGTAGQVSPAVGDVVTGVVNVVAATLVGGGLPAADLAGLPALPSTPEAATPEAATPANPS
ncbi:hypothetical protein GCM10022384_62970 [Streptomyces marokkonensis]|uniref:Secreted protein n=1 Tax=Streptomyces marokkonensis TaxID=324855 RepID=A0ABP7S9H8_9ACTN